MALKSAHLGLFAPRCTDFCWPIVYKCPTMSLVSLRGALLKATGFISETPDQCVHPEVPTNTLTESLWQPPSPLEVIEWPYTTGGGGGYPPPPHQSDHSDMRPVHSIAMKFELLQWNHECQSDHCGKKRSLPRGEFCWAIFGTQTFGSQTPPAPTQELRRLCYTG